MATTRTIPGDVLSDILLRLPVKSLLRFRCVRKSWQSLIQSPKFISAHLRRAALQPSPPLLLKRVVPGPRINALSSLSNQTLASIRDLDLPLFSDDPNMEILGPSHGVFCLSSGHGLALWNPATRETRVVPNSPVPRPPERDCLLAGIGFGFDPNNRDLKVVRVVAHYDETGMDCDYMAEVYSVNSNSWKLVEGEVNGFVLAAPRAHTYGNGVYYWLAAGEGAGTLVSFDMATEVFRETPLPEYPDIVATEICRNYMKFDGDCDGDGGSLTVVAYPYLEDSTMVDVWTMNEEGGELTWTKRLGFGPLAGVDTPLGFWKDDEFLLETRSGELISYNLNTEEIRKFQIQGEARKLQLLPYVESLVSLRGGNVVGE